MDWRHNAVCRDEDPELFFPVGNSGPALAQIADAKLVCNRCPVTTECLSWALNTGQDAGVWGGMSEDERRDDLRPFRRERCARITAEGPISVCYLVTHGQRHVVLLGHVGKGIAGTVVIAARKDRRRESKCHGSRTPYRRRRRASVRERTQGVAFAL